MLLLMKPWVSAYTARGFALQLTVTREPCWLTASPSTFLRAACSRWVAVWLLRARRLINSSTVAVTCRAVHAVVLNMWVTLQACKQR